MTVYQALLAALNRTPGEGRIFWQESHRRECERWWVLEGIVSDLHELGAEDDESAELVARARAEQHRIHGDQADRALIRDRLCDEND